MKQYQICDHTVTILWDEFSKDFIIQAVYKKPPGGLEAYYVPQIKFSRGVFSCDLSMPMSLILQYPDDVEKLMRGIQLTVSLVAEIKKILKEEYNVE